MSVEASGASEADGPSAPPGGEVPRKGRTYSEHLEVLLEVVFAVILAEGLQQYPDVLTDPFAPVHLVVLLALFNVYFIAGKTWIDWKRRVDRMPYREGEPGEQLRFGIDLVSVVAYQYLILTLGPLASNPRANAFRHLIGYPLLFVLHLASVRLQAMRYPAPLPHMKALLASLAFTVAMVLAYRLWYPHFGSAAAWLNAAFLFVALLVTALYRLIRSSMLRRSRPTPA